MSRLLRFHTSAGADRHTFSTASADCRTSSMSCRAWPLALASISNARPSGPTRVLLDHDTSNCGLGTAYVTLCISGHVSQHVPDGPRRQKAVATYVIVAKRLDQ